MSRLIPVGEPDQAPRYFVEVEGLDDPLRAAGAATLTGLTAVGSAVADACTDIVERLADAMNAAVPTEVELELGVAISAEGGIPIFTKLGTEGTIKVTLRWDETAMIRLAPPG